MYLSLLGEPSDEPLERYPTVHLTDPMNGILLSWTSPTHLVMGSLLGPMTPMRDQSKLSVFCITHPYH